LSAKFPHNDETASFFGPVFTFHLKPNNSWWGIKTLLVGGALKHASGERLPCVGGAADLTQVATFDYPSLLAEPSNGIKATEMGHGKSAAYQPLAA